MQDIDQRDRELLGALQGDIPLAATPFAFVGQAIDMSEKEVIKRTERLRREGLIRQIGLHFDTRALGYRFSLVAARVAPEKIDDAAAVINAHPGVTQNYRRNHDFNLWFTIATGPSSKLGIDRTIEILGDEAGCEAVRPLPTLRLFKSSSSDALEQHSAVAVPLSSTDIESIRLLQRELPLQPRPFEALARNASAALSPDEIIASARSLMERGLIRRFTASVQSRKQGFSATAMGVWVVPEADVDEYAARFSQHKAVSHCYLRPVYDDWPFNVYTTVHGRSVDECESIINDLAADTGLRDKRALYPTREYKKTRITFFAPEADEWEQAHSGKRAAEAS